MPELVAIDMTQGPELPLLLARVWDRGDAACVLDARLTGAARTVQLDALAPTRVIGDDGDEIRLEDGVGTETGDALVVTTSGSLAAPRAAVLTHDAVAASAHATSARLAVDPSTDRWLCCLPCAHIGGLAVVTRAMVTGTGVVVHAGFDPDLVAAASVETTLVSLVATALRRVGEPLAFRAIVLGGAAVPASIPSNVVTTWGLTETGSGVVYDGVPLDGVEVVTRDGELLVRAPMCARAYRDGTSIDAVGPDGSRGWLATGDAGRVVGGRVEVHGRIAEMITTGGEKVWPADVERPIAALGSVEEVAVWRRVDPEWGERVVAWVVPVRTPPTLAEVRSAVTAVLPPWAAPKELVVVAALPRAPSGKVVRRLLEASGTP